MSSTANICFLWVLCSLVGVSFAESPRVSIGSKYICNIAVRNTLLSKTEKVLSATKETRKIKSLNKKLSNQLKLLSLSKNEKRRLKLKKMENIHLILEVNRCVNNQGIYTLQSTCPLKVNDQTLEVTENGSTAINLAPLNQFSGCGALSYQITNATRFGTLTGISPQFTFRWTDHRGDHDSFTYEARDEVGNSDSATISLNVIAGPEKFAGLATSLAPYRDTHDIKEVRHLLGHVAFGAPEFETIGVNQGLDALVEALLNTPEDPQVTARALEVASEANQIFAGRWGVYGLWAMWLHQLRYGNPLRMKMVSVFDDHFGVNLSEHSNSLVSHKFLKQHFDFLYDHALGSFEDMAQAALFDGALAHSLNLFQNHADSINENFPRELMQLFLLGEVDPVTGLPNYTDSPNGDLRKASIVLEGFTNYAYFSPWAGWEWKIDWDRDLWSGAPVDIFGITSNFDPGQFTNGHPFVSYLMYAHPGAARYIAKMLIKRLTHVDPTPEMKEELASTLLMTHYDLKSALRRILKSSAMFSPQSKTGCYTSPLENFITMLRVFNIPLFKVTAYGDLQDLYALAAQYLDASGQMIGSPVNGVFGYGECGGHLGKTGDKFLGAQQVLNRERHSNMFFAGLDFGKNYTNPPFHWSSTLPNLQDISSENIPSVILSSFSDRLGIEFNQAERDILLTYLATRFEGNTSGTYWTVGVTWNVNDPLFEDLATLKASGLLQAFLLDPKFNVR